MCLLMQWQCSEDIPKLAVNHSQAGYCHPSSHRHQELEVDKCLHPYAASKIHFGTSSEPYEVKILLVSEKKIYIFQSPKMVRCDRKHNRPNTSDGKTWA